MMNPDDLLNKRNKLQENNNFKQQENREIKIENRQQVNNEMELVANKNYYQNLLQNNIGKLIKIEFLIGTNNIISKIGFLENIDANYIILRSLEGDSLIYAESSYIRFITTYTQYSSINNLQGLNTGYGNFNQRYY